MPTRPTPAFLKMMEILADGLWHAREEMVEALMLTFPAAQAIAHRNTWTRGGASKVSLTRQVQVGRRDLANRVLQSAVTNGTVERDGDRYRLGRKEK